MPSYRALCAQQRTPDSKVHAANMGSIWGRQNPGGPHVGPMNLAIWDWYGLFIDPFVLLLTIRCLYPPGKW